MQTVRIEDATEKLASLIEAAASGEVIIITKHDQPHVKLIAAVARKEATPTFGSAKGLITYSDDLNAPLDDFKDYL